MIDVKIRKELVEYAFDDWKRIMKNGLSAKEARESVEADYELVEAEIVLINSWMLDELETQMENK